MKDNSASAAFNIHFMFAEPTRYFRMSSAPLSLQFHQRIFPKMARMHNVKLKKCDTETYYLIIHDIVAVHFNIYRFLIIAIQNLFC